MVLEKNLNQLRAVVAAPFEEASQRKRQGQKVIGWLLTDVPEELIHAAGAFPVGILGSNSNIRLADTHLQTWACSLMRSSLELGLRGDLEFLDGLLIPHTCDTARMMVGLWRKNCCTPYIESFLMPRQVNRPSAGKYLLGELQRLKTNLEQQTGVLITDDKLRASIKLFNENRRLLRQMVKLHADFPGLIASRDVYTVIKAAMFMDKAEHNQILQDLIQGMEQKAMTIAGDSNSPVRLVISGGVWEPPAIMDFIEEAGGIVVSDDLLTGARYLGPDAAIDDNPLAALAERQLCKIPFACYDNQEAPRTDFLIDLVRRSQATGLIFLHLKFCEPENYDYNSMCEALDAAGIPNLRLETEYTNLNLGQSRTRLEAFIEMIGGI